MFFEWWQIATFFVCFILFGISQYRLGKAQGLKEFAHEYKAYTIAVSNSVKQELEFLRAEGAMTFMYLMIKKGILSYDPKEGLVTGLNGNHHKFDDPTAITKVLEMIDKGEV